MASTCWPAAFKNDTDQVIAGILHVLPGQFGTTGEIRLHFKAKKVHIVASANDPRNRRRLDLGRSEGK